MGEMRLKIPVRIEFGLAAAKSNSGNHRVADWPVGTPPAQSLRLAAWRINQPYVDSSTNSMRCRA
ncbi:hypothetical protein ASPTUDRAFT_678684 [Aspergillus tubingensis CBS 134.48]|uniref:Uncharacterized protein n=1 Tax=Aspergillus tubingensis (strain CBS 134.48) TaxID=767770 RepID=A0A1L9MZZ3_ASPTC|nr:hypothetical protein ASPTUDRAFT_678684 [Aspergillus tubingensis CBS 134.48]